MEEEKSQIIAEFRRMDSRILLLFCTSAFGMGMDVPDIRTCAVIMCTGSLVDLYQWLGRAGRDGQFSFAWLLYHRGANSLASMLTCVVFWTSITVSQNVPLGQANQILLPYCREDSGSSPYDMLLLVRITTDSSGKTQDSYQRRRRFSFVTVAFTSAAYGAIIFDRRGDRHTWNVYSTGCAPAFSTRRPARRAAGQQPAAGENFEEKTATFSISLYKH